MENKTVNIEKLIHEIEEMKRINYECFHMTEGLEDPDVLMQASSRLMGTQMAYDDIIFYLRNLQGCDEK